MATAEATGRTTRVRDLATPAREFLATEVGSAVVLLAAAVTALVWANVPWGDTYEELWTAEASIRIGGAEVALDLRHWVNDGLMAFFFFLVGLEIRRELDMGELRDRRRVAAPVIAAFGGMLVPVLLYLSFNAGGDGARGWGIVMATDTAFALGVLALVGRRCPFRLRVFVLTMVVIDDIGALLVIAAAYTDDLDVRWLALAVALFVVVLLVRGLRVWRGPAYFVVGAGIWVATLESGIHPTIAGVALGLLTTAYPPSRTDLERATALTRSFREQPTPELAHSARLSVEQAISPNERLQHRLHPWTSFVVVPLFALANAGVELSGSILREAFASPITLGILVGLVVGKPVGVLASSWLARTRGLPSLVSLPALGGAGAVAGIGFTVSLFIAELSFTGDRLDQAKIGILGASLAATALGIAVFRALPERAPEEEAEEELDRPVDPQRDHVRGPAEAPVTLVEYGDYECPYCGMAEPVIRDLLAEFGDELRYVFRHVPLLDVHEHAQLAAEAAEAAGAQGRFWEMHDRLFAHQDRLESRDVLDDARALGLDLERFREDLRTRRFAPRVARDVMSAEESGVVGTPTFFVNGRRHRGAYDRASLEQAVRAARPRR